MELYSLNFTNGKKYIGISCDATKRFKSHKNAAQRGEVLPVHRAIRKHGCELQILVRGEKAYISALEKAAIAIYQTQKAKLGYNICSGGEFNSLGIKRSKQTCKRISNALTGKRLSAEHRAKLKGYKHTEESKLIMRNKKIGIKLTEEHRIKIGIAGTGKKRSLESKARYAASKQGILNPMAGKTHTPETRAKIASAGRGRKYIRSAEYNAKMSAAKKGVPWTDARRAAQNLNKK